MRWHLTDSLRSRLEAERGRPFPRGGRGRIAMAYPSPYRVGMSSLGYQWVGSQLADAGFGVERVFLPDDVEAWKKQRSPPLSMETHSALGDFPLICVSLAYELELAGLVTLLEMAGIPPLRENRGPQDPKILIGGPLTFSNPLPAAPFADAMLLGEVEDVLLPAVEGFFEEGSLDHVAGLAGGYIETIHGDRLPPVAKASDALLPARSRILTADTELSNMFLIEGERGCHRECTFCVMRRSTNGGMRLVSPEAILGYVPEEARRVGLVGAAISDHPRLVELLGAIVDSGREVGISSLRADRIALKPDIARLLRKGGYQTLTVASDAASQRLRRTIKKGTTEAHLMACAEAAAEHKYKMLKVYMMLGLPGEEEEDVEELIAFTLRLAAVHPVALGVAPFVPKLNTPLDRGEFAGVGLVERRLERIQKAFRGTRAELRSTSAKWAWVEYRLAQGGPATGRAVLQAVAGGGSFGAWKRALGAEGERIVPPSIHHLL
jgi:radical SAM superfamily enzyme YgiQ (UPF0313 family)